MRSRTIIMVAAAAVLAACSGRYTGPTAGTSGATTRARADTTNPGGTNNTDTAGMGNVGGVNHGAPGLAPPDSGGTHGTTSPGSFPGDTSKTGGRH